MTNASCDVPNIIVRPDKAGFLILVSLFPTVHGVGRGALAQRIQSSELVTFAINFTLGHNRNGSGGGGFPVSRGVKVSSRQSDLGGYPNLH